mgnify:CR=1 FL=1
MARAPARSTRGEARRAELAERSKTGEEKTAYMQKAEKESLKVRISTPLAGAALYKCVSSSKLLTYLQGALSPRVERVRLLRVQG